MGLDSFEALFINHIKPGQEHPSPAHTFTVTIIKRCRFKKSSSEFSFKQDFGPNRYNPTVLTR